MWSFRIQHSRPEIYANGVVTAQRGRLKLTRFTELNPVRRKSVRRAFRYQGWDRCSDFLPWTVWQQMRESDQQLQGHVACIESISVRSMKPFRRREKHGPQAR